MGDLQQAARRWADGFASFEAGLGASWPDWSRQQRREAIERFAGLGFPTTRREDWRYTNVAPLADRPFSPDLGDVTGRVDDRALDLHPLAAVNGPRLVFVDGRLHPALSRTDSLPDRVRLIGLADGAASEPSLLEPWLGHADLLDDQPFSALNGAFLQDGAALVVPDGVVIEEPIHLVFLSTDPGEATVAHTRTVVVAGRSSEATLIESHHGPDGSAYLTNAVTEIRAGANAAVRHYRVQLEGSEAYHVAALAVRLARDSRVTSGVFSLGAALARSDIRVLFDGEGAEAVLDGLYLASGHQHTDNQTTVDHAVPHCRSDETYRGILDGRGRGVFNGKVIVRPDAQKTEAHQNNKNLLLSDDVQVHAKPQLEINADDVKCTHGATIGRLDRDAVFYLRSRGIGDGDARRLLTAAFADEIAARTRVPALAGALEAEIHRRLGADGARS